MGSIDAAEVKAGALALHRRHIENVLRSLEGWQSGDSTVTAV